MIPVVIDPRVAKLPVWAQDEIKRLARLAADYKDMLEEQTQKIPDSNVGVIQYGAPEGAPKVVFLPRDSVVRFYFDRQGAARDVQGIEVSINQPTQHRKQSIRVTTWAGQIAVFPLAANCFNVCEVFDAP